MAAKYGLPNMAAKYGLPNMAAKYGLPNTACQIWLRLNLLAELGSKLSLVPSGPLPTGEGGGRGHLYIGIS